MSSRAIRRAAERQALKSMNPTTTPPVPHQITAEPPETVTPISEARLLANRENAQRSTGPLTVEGKAKSSLNAVKTGLTGRTVLLPSDDAAIYQAHLARFVTQYAPATDEEKTLVQSIGDSEWRLLRIVPLEAGIYAIGRRELAAEFADEADPVTREALILAKILLTYRKDLTNLGLQERRLRSQRNADIAQLETLQNARREKRGKDIFSASGIYRNALKRGLPFEPAFFGFDFSTEDLTSHLLHEEAKNFLRFDYSELPREKFDAYFAQWKDSRESQNTKAA